MLEREDNNRGLIRVQYAETRLEPIWACLVGILKDPENIIPKLEEYTFKNTNREKVEEKINYAEKQIESVISERSRIVRVFVDGMIPEKDYKFRLTECENRIAELQNEKIKNQQALIKREERKDRDEILKKLYAKIKDKLESASYEDKMFITHLFIERINLYHKANYAEVFFRFPSSTLVKQNESVAPISKESDLRLVLHVKTLSERERRSQLSHEIHGK